MRRDAVLRLTRLHLHRTLKPMWKFGLVTIGVVMIPVFLGGGLNPDMTVAAGAVFLLYLPGSLALNMTQEKIDGSLRFLSSLPVTGREHAASRVLASAALTMPLVIWLAVLLPLFQLESLAGGPVVTGIGMGAAVFLVSLVVIAFQYKYSGPKARSVFVYALAAFVAVIWISTLVRRIGGGAPHPGGDRHRGAGLRHRGSGRRLVRPSHDRRFTRPSMIVRTTN